MATAAAAAAAVPGGGGETDPAAAAAAAANAEVARLREAVQRLRDGSGAAAAEQGRLLEGMHGQHLLLLDYHSKARGGRGAACVRACEGRKGGGFAEEGGTPVSGCGWGGRWRGAWCGETNLNFKRRSEASDAGP